MNPIFLFEAQRTVKQWPAYLIAIILAGMGIFCGSQFNLTAGEGIYLNSPYTVGFMTGMLSLSIIFTAVIYAVQLLYKDQDSKFSHVLFFFLFLNGPISVENSVLFFYRLSLAFSF